LYAPEDRDGTLLLEPGQDGYTVLGEAFADIRIIDGLNLTIGRRGIDTPFINRNDSRMTPNTFEEIVLQGRIEFDARVIDDGETTWLIVEAAEAAPLAEWLNKMKFMLRVEITDVSGGWAVLGSTKPVEKLGGYLVWEDPWPHVGPGGYSYSTVPEESHPGLERPWFEYLVPAADLESVIEGLPLAGAMAAGVPHHCCRIETEVLRASPRHDRPAHRQVRHPRAAGDALDERISGHSASRHRHRHRRKPRLACAARGPASQCRAEAGRGEGLPSG